MIVDGLTKALSKIIFKRFVEMVGLKDQEERLGLIRREEELKEHIKELRSGDRSGEECFQ